MSRGLGALQRRVLEALADRTHYVTIAELAASVCGEGPTRSDLVSLRRAVHGLAERRLLWTRLERLAPHVQTIVGLPSTPLPDCPTCRGGDRCKDCSAQNYYHEATDIVTTSARPSVGRAATVTVCCQSCGVALGQDVYYHKGWPDWPLCEPCCDAPDQHGHRRSRSHGERRPCACCGRTMHGVTGQRRCCSHACSARTRRLRRRTDRRCACGVVFTPARSDALTCSNACRQRSYRERAAATAEAPR